MKFGSVPLSEAQGAILAHSADLPDGRLRKGRVLSADDILALQATGRRDIVVARLDPDDVGEDAAALRLAQAVVPDPDRAGLRLGAAATGRVNVFAQTPGVTEVITDRVHALNAVDPMITLATVPPWQRLGAGGMVATVKIISYAVPETALNAACHAGQGALRLHGVTRHRAVLIETVVGNTPVGGKGYEVTRARLDRMGVALAPRVAVPHRVGALAHALSAVQADIVLILTGSATSDADDVAPAAVRAAGGVVIQFGMPVDPGNLLFLGSMDRRPVIGLPGCARSPASNGADWVLERLLCGVQVTPADIAQMGVGGLLKEIPQRGRLREA